jgi:hypothetical protein
LIGYVREIASRTEQYWCPIKHARRVIGTHSRYALFEDYGDAEGYRKWLEQFERVRRRSLSIERHDVQSPRLSILCAPYLPVARRVMTTLMSSASSAFVVLAGAGTGRRPWLVSRTVGH